MIDLVRKARSAATAPVSPTPASAAVPVSAREQELQDLLRRWMSLADVQQRVMDALCRDASDMSAAVERECNALSLRYRDIADASRHQAERIGEIAAMTNAIELAGEKVPLSEIASLLSQVLNDVVAKIVFLSRNAMSMVYALDAVKRNVEEVEKGLSRIDSITKQTNMLALNATIEAVRAGEAGKAFGVVASEVKELSKSTRDMAETMHSEIAKIVDSVRESHKSLKQVATVDMSQNMIAKDRVDQWVTALVARNSVITATIEAASGDALTLARSIDSIVAGGHFQDRVKQRLDRVVDALSVIRQAAHELQADSATIASETPAEPLAADLEWLRRLAARSPSGAIVVRLLQGDGDTAADASTVGSARRPTSVPEEFSKQFNFTENDATVELKGELTFVDHSLFRAMATRLLQAKAHASVIDLSHLEFIDSAGLGMLLLVRDEAKRGNRQLVLRHPVGQVKRIFDISKFETLFAMQP